MKHGQIVSPSTFIAKPSNTDKSFHPELLKTKNPYFNKCPKTIVLAFKKHQFRTLVKNTIFRATDPKTLKEMTPYRIKNWICPAICILTDMKQEMDEDLFDQMAEALHQSSNPQNPPATTSTRWKPDGTYDKKPLDRIRPIIFKVLSQEIINPFHLSRLRTNHHKQIQSIKTPSNQQMYEQQTTLKIKPSH